MPQRFGYLFEVQDAVACKRMYRDKYSIKVSVFDILSLILQICTVCALTSTCLSCYDKCNASGAKLTEQPYNRTTSRRNATDANATPASRTTAEPVLQSPGGLYPHRVEPTRAGTYTLTLSYEFRTFARLPVQIGFAAARQARLSSSALLTLQAQHTHHARAGSVRQSDGFFWIFSLMAPGLRKSRGAICFPGVKRALQEGMLDNPTIQILQPGTLSESRKWKVKLANTGAR
ncbi:hypothetical protein BJ138DRAFT_1105683 [Hygrophoropsis aurantiaca]|uniref:Uncharacterized protein n=1 Tax=Hygrophoropsis aurantiaca TaxID=72124 RepID=A0ACB7ZXM4_9AGAM|nr:hypothetical protein BJ138DRAFT_1105683 [Hygrophoropsis aurantiaca]